MRPIKIGIIVGVLIAGAGFMVSALANNGSIGRTSEFILATSAAAPSVLAEIILARLRLSPSVFGGSPHWPFIFCFWALTGFVFGWLFAAKSLRVRLVVFFLLAGLVFLYRLGAIEFKKGLRESMSAGAEYLKNDAASLMAIFKESDEKRMK